jgi:hypothetical protein
MSNRPRTRHQSRLLEAAEAENLRNSPASEDSHPPILQRQRATPRNPASAQQSATTKSRTMTDDKSDSDVGTQPKRSTKSKRTTSDGDYTDSEDRTQTRITAQDIPRQGERLDRPSTFDENGTAEQSSENSPSRLLELIGDQARDNGALSILAGLLQKSYDYGPEILPRAILDLLIRARKAGGNAPDRTPQFRFDHLGHSSPVADETYRREISNPGAPLSEQGNQQGVDIDVHKQVFAPRGDHETDSAYDVRRGLQAEVLEANDAQDLAYQIRRSVKGKWAEQDAPHEEHDTSACRCRLCRGTGSEKAPRVPRATEEFGLVDQSQYEPIRTAYQTANSSRITPKASRAARAASSPGYFMPE